MSKTNKNNYLQTKTLKNSKHMESNKQKMERILDSHIEIMKNTEWKGNETTKQLENEYYNINLTEREYCMECNRLARLTCNYH